MTKNSRITRRDFLNGAALSVGVGVGAGAAISPMQLLAKQPGTKSQTYYPPSLTGLRGTHKGAFEVAHSVAWQGKKWPIPSQQTDDTYDLVVVGGGLSGLSAALFFQKQMPDARIMILENHDDIGGHAKRNEFSVGGKQLIGYGGSQSIDTPSGYSKVSADLLKELSIDTARFYDYYDQGFKKRWGLQAGLYFSKEHYGQNKITDDIYRQYDLSDRSIIQAIEQFPIPELSRQKIIDYVQGKLSLTPDTWSYQEKIGKLRKISYCDFLRNYAHFDEDAVDIFTHMSKSLWGISWDALSTLEAVRLEMPGTEHLNIEYDDIAVEDEEGEDEPYIFHFPDGNASIARAIVRKLIPSSLEGNSMEDIVLKALDYSQLDKSQSPVRIRLNSTAVHVEHNDKQAVDVTYVHNQKTYKVRGKHVVMACYNNIIPYICPELPKAQREAIQYATKTPIVYANIAVRNWNAFAKSGYDRFFMPKHNLFHSFSLDYPVSMGGYQFAKSPDHPTVLHATMCPTMAHQGLSGREQNRIGRQQIYQTSFEQYEQDLFQQLDGALSPYGFDAIKDVAAITVNRWPHGYAYEYNELFDPADWSPKKGPHIEGRAQIGRISIANSDASAFAYVNGAIDAADRAVKEQLALEV